MYVLGIGGLGYKDSSAAILNEGRVVAAASEERFTGIKHQGGFPHLAVRFCLDRAGLQGARDLNAIAVADNPWLRAREKVFRWYGEDFFRSRTAHVYHIFKDDSSQLVEYLLTLEQLRSQGVAIHPVRHITSHLAAAFFGSPFERAALLNLDGRGEISTSGLGRGAGNSMELDAVSQMPDSIGLVYALVAHHLGFSDLDDEFRLISMSPTGTPTYTPKMREVIQVAGDGTTKLNPEYFGFHEGRAYLSERFAEAFGPRRDPALPLMDQQRDLAASLHAVVLEMVLKMARHARERADSGQLCLGGGLAGNWALVGAICESGIFEDVYVPMAPGDDGTALGAALSVHHTEMDGPRQAPLLRADFGPSFPETEIAAELERLKLKAAKPADLAVAAADRISSGEILGWFQGAAEFGPRALGSRSILANPTDPATRPRLVASVKARSEVHPFGLSIPVEAAGDLFTDLKQSPFLERTGRLTPDAAKRLPAALATDGRARVHTVDPQRHPLFHRLLHEVGKKTGVPAVLNTSLNEPGRPMATTPREAIGSLYTTGLDALALGPYVIAK
jgi:carbamoyltransferase